MHPFFTIITPVLNNHKILRCVDSIIDQSFKNYEHLIMDGNSNQEQLKIFSASLTIGSVSIYLVPLSILLVLIRIQIP